MRERFAALGIHIPEILLPVEGIDLKKWGCVACDQYTAQPEYWQAAYDLVGEAPSTLAMVLPELFLGTPRQEVLEREIPQKMEKYLADGTLRALPPGMILVERTRNGNTRTGLMLALDLEHYGYALGSAGLIRATEKTIVERIPPRMTIRRRAVLELPHIMVLMDDPGDRVMTAARTAANRDAPLYDTELMMNGGHLSGYGIPEERLAPLCGALEGLIRGQEQPLLFAMGDGNHSLATAKACWEERKATLSPRERATDSARYALVEAVNLHDAGLVFEPIHRVIFDTKPGELLEALTGALANRGIAFAPQSASAGCAIGVVTQEGERRFGLCLPEGMLPIAALQPALDQALKEVSGVQDYIHGEDSVRVMCERPGRLGLLLPSFEKADLFPTVQSQGVLPRKSFSMGEADDKRFYFECRRIR